MQVLHSGVERGLSKCSTAPFELGEPYLAFFRGRAKLLARLRTSVRSSMAVDLFPFTYRGQVENVHNVAAVEYVQEDVYRKFGESASRVWLVALRHG